MNAKVTYVGIIGNKEQENETITIRRLGVNEQDTYNVDEFLTMMKTEISSRAMPPAAKRHGMKTIAIIGAGPGGLMAAESLARLGYTVDVYDHKPSPARKFLMAGRGGLNITHSEPIDSFLQKYGEAAEFMRPMIGYFTPKICGSGAPNWAKKLLSAHRDASFLKVLNPPSSTLMAWTPEQPQCPHSSPPSLDRMEWKGELAFTTPEQKFIKADATILALGGHHGQNSDLMDHGSTNWKNTT